MNTLEQIYSKHGVEPKLEKVYARYSKPEPESLLTRIEKILAFDKRESVAGSVQDHNQRLFQAAVDRTLNYAQARAEKLLEDKKKAEKRKAQLEDEVAAVFFLLMADAASESLQASANRLGEAEGLETAKATEELEKEFIAQRREVLGGFPADVAAKMAEIVKKGEKEGLADKEIKGEIAAETAALKSGRGKLVSATEAQAAYGASQLWILKRAGFKTGRWVTVGDEKVRQSHLKCELAGEIPLGDKYPNGLRFPGDPKGSAEEVCNCRCILIGGSR